MGWDTIRNESNKNDLCVRDPCCLCYCYIHISALHILSYMTLIIDQQPQPFERLSPPKNREDII